MANGPISWQSKKQPTVALSSMEAEYMAESLAARQVIWLRTLTTELGIPYPGPTTLHVDNQGAINYSNNAINHSRTKHIDIQHHFVCEKLVSNEMQLQYCTTDDNLADIFTKGPSDVPARLGPKAAALAWPEPALAFSRAGPSQSRHSRLGPGLAWPKPRLLAHILVKFIYNAIRHGKNNVELKKPWNVIEQFNLSPSSHGGIKQHIYRLELSIR
jgi:hypothetical protein